MEYKFQKIVDAHVHPGSMLFAQELFQQREDQRENPCVQSVTNLMDRHGVDQAIAIVSQGISPVHLENELVIKIAKQIPDRFPAVMVGFSQPQDEPWNYDSQAAADEIEGYLKNDIVKGLGEFAIEAVSYMGDWGSIWPRLRPVFEVLAAHHAPALFHTGVAPFMQFGNDGKRAVSRRSVYWGNPIFIDDIATEFPDVPIIIGHCGVQAYFFYGTYADMALTVAARHPNVYLETSSAPYEVLKKAVMDPAIGPEKLIFGTDSPAFYHYYTDENGEHYPTYGKTGPGECIPDHYKYDLEFVERLPVTENQKQMILGGTITRLFDEKR